jgi:hypothetical protein
VGRPVKDVYGRYLGSVVGFSIDNSGELRSIGLDQSGGEFHEFASNRIISDKDGFIVIPSWKLDADALGRETETVRRRAQALADLEKEGEVPADLRDEMHGQYDGELKGLRESYSTLEHEARRRVEALDRQVKSLDRFLLNLKVQFRSGEIDEGTFKAEAEYCAQIKLRDTKEKEDLHKLLRTVIDPAVSGSTTTTVSPVAENKSVAENKPIAAIPQVTIA